VKVWVTGANGLLGRAVCAQLGAAAIATGRELDVTDAAAIARFAETTPFTHVIHCAAFTKVDLAESQEAEARRCNVDGARNVALAARQRQARCVQVSTDYVFPGDANVPYAEDAPTGPINAYGRTKLDGERAALELDATVVRTSWLYGKGGPSFVATMLRLLAERPEVRVVADQRGRPTYAADLAKALIALLDAPPGVWHFANAGETTWYELACAVRDLARLPGKVTPITTAEYPTPARRPAYSVLSTARFERALYAPRPWRDALAEHLGDV
jgi:dTDP-4-dehydrorhamnose reductase